MRFRAVPGGGLGDCRKVCIFCMACVWRIYFAQRVYCVYGTYILTSIMIYSHKVLSSAGMLSVIFGEQ